MTPVLEPCRWCRTLFVPRMHGGRKQEYCRPTCRHEFHSASRRYGMAMIREGFLTTEALRHWYQTNVHVEETG